MPQQSEKLSVYPESDKPLVVVETETELERQIGNIRHAVQGYTRDALQTVRSGVDRVVQTEHKVENRLDKLVAKDESLTPNGLYVGVATLASMVFTRHRSFPIRWITPPVVFALSLKYFLPHTAENTANYYESIEQKKFPELSQKRQSAWNTIKEKWGTGVSHLEMAGYQTKDAISSGIQNVEKSTGLKVGSIIPTGTVPEAAPQKADKAKLV